jgi:hypothetical protein
MADVTTYKRATISYFSTASGGAGVKVGEIRAAADAVVTANPAYWVAFTDAELSTGALKVRS